MDSVFPMCSPRVMRLPPQIHFMVSDIRPPWALTLPLNSQDIGTSRWQLAIESYTYFRPIRKGSPLPQLCRFSAAGNDSLTTRYGDRRLKSAKARSRGKLGTGWQRALWGF